MRTKKVNPGLGIVLIIMITGCIVFFYSTKRLPRSQNAISENNHLSGSSIMQFLSDQPLRFIADRGQTGTQAAFHVQGAGHTVLFYRDRINLRRIESKKEKNEIVLKFKGANHAPAVEGAGELPGVAHFFKGSDPHNWQTGVPTFESVLYRELYPGIDMAYIGDDGILESEFYVSPGSNHHQIQLDYQGIISKRIREDGALVL
jgi:hypothetical protein